MFQRGSVEATRFFSWIVLAICSEKKIFLLNQPCYKIAQVHDAVFF